IRRAGVALTSTLIKDARRIGIRRPDLVRLRAVEKVPPMNPMLRLATQRIGLCSSGTRGMSLRYGIFIASDCWGERSLAVHELAHTWQYERMGGIKPFLKEYLSECMV